MNIHQRSAFDVVTGSEAPARRWTKRRQSDDIDNFLDEATKDAKRKEMSEYKMFVEFANCGVFFVRGGENPWIGRVTGDVQARFAG